MRVAQTRGSIWQAGTMCGETHVEPSSLLILAEEPLGVVESWPRRSRRCGRVQRNECAVDPSDSIPMSFSRSLSDDDVRPGNFAHANQHSASRHPAFRCPEVTTLTCDAPILTITTAATTTTTTATTTATPRRPYRITHHGSKRTAIQCIIVGGASSFSIHPADPSHLWYGVYASVRPGPPPVRYLFWTLCSRTRECISCDT